MIQLTEEMRRLINNNLADGCPCILATASPAGEPGVSYRGSMMAFSDDSLAYWDRTKRAGLEHVEANPKVVVMYRNPKERKSWKFHGEATVVKEGPLWEAVKAKIVQQELDRDALGNGFAVIIRLSRVMTLGGEVLQER
ncbi:MAG: pyridoxamine 5'-phosphate oxidase family protein [Chloroflexi bacterium]|nr:pyridoxamine 5'-phosphate oxidase family protein [Chloroflexota bacterium]